MSQRETTTEARQGERGFPVLKVLVVGLITAVVAGAILLTYQGAKSPDQPSQTTAKEQTAKPAEATSREQPGNPNSSAPGQAKP